MSDLISRVDAIEAVANAIWHYPNECYYNLNDFDMAEALAKDALKALPSAEAVSREEYESMKRANEFNMRMCSEVEHELHDLKQKQADAVQGIGRYENAMQKLREMPMYLNGVKEKQITKISADRPQGEWIVCHNVDRHTDIYQCNNCYDVNWYPANYCPNCGAKMKGKE